jgi:transposase
MSERFADILANLPAKQPRSRLEPYRELIEELRKRKLTFQEIAAVLAAKCGVSVTGSGVHDYLRRRRDPRRESPPVSRSTRSPLSDSNQTKQSLKKRNSVSDYSTSFEFDAQAPLKLPGIRGK